VLVLPLLVVAHASVSVGEGRVGCEYHLVEEIEVGVALLFLRQRLLLSDLCRIY